MQQKKLDCYKGKDCMKRFCKGLGDHAMKIKNYEEKKNDTTNCIEILALKRIALKNCKKSFENYVEFCINTQKDHLCF